MKAKRYMRPTVGSQLATAEARIEELTAEVSRLQRLRAAERALRLAQQSVAEAFAEGLLTDPDAHDSALRAEEDARLALRAAGGEP